VTSFRATSEGVEVRIGRRELAVLDALPSLLATISAEDDDDPAVGRLFPAAYADDAAELEFRRFAGSEIQRARQEDNDVFSDVLGRLDDGSTVLSLSETEACMRSVGAARIAIAARHGLFDQDAYDTSVETPHGTIVAFLGLLQEELVAALGDAEEVGDGR
jgi:hypothetical protein